LIRSLYVLASADVCASVDVCNQRHCGLLGADGEWLSRCTQPRDELPRRADIDPITFSPRPRRAPIGIEDHLIGG